jgi:hypothetical protein
MKGVLPWLVPWAERSRTERERRMMVILDGCCKVGREGGGVGAK